MKTGFQCPEEDVFLFANKGATSIFSVGFHPFLFTEA